MRLPIPEDRCFNDLNRFTAHIAGPFDLRNRIANFRPKAISAGRLETEKSWKWFMFEGCPIFYLFRDRSMCQDQNAGVSSARERITGPPHVSGSLLTASIWRGRVREDGQMRVESLSELTTVMTTELNTVSVESANRAFGGLDRIWREVL